MITLEQIANLHRSKRFIVDVVNDEGITECTIVVERRTVSGTLVSDYLDSVLSEIANRKVLSIYAVDNFGPTINISVLSNRHKTSEEAANGQS